MKKKSRRVPTLDEWAEKSATALRADVRCHIKEMTTGKISYDDQESLERLTMISIRQWAEENGL